MFHQLCYLSLLYGYYRYSKMTVEEQEAFFFFEKIIPRFVGLPGNEVL